MHWRRASSIFSYWADGRFVVENYRTGQAVSASPVTARVLDLFDSWRSLEEICQELPEYSFESVRRSIRQLMRNGLLVAEGSPQSQDDQRFLESWSSWTPHAAILHFGSKDVPYTSSNERAIKRLRAYLKEGPQPESFKCLSRKPRSKDVSLPYPPPAKSSFLRVLLERRTHRAFAPEPLDIGRLSTLLHYTWGVTGSINHWLLGALPLKTSPSAGARHPCEVYVVALGVSGLSPGLYHYASDRNALEHIPVKVSRKKAGRYCARQAWVEAAAALFLITAVFPRSMWKYRFSRAYRTVLADAAHLSQTFCLVATYLRLAPFCTMALKDSLIERDLGIDGVNESILYVTGVGLPAQRPSS